MTDAPRVLCLLTDSDDEAENTALIEALTDAVSKLPVIEPTPEQLAVRQRNHDRLIRLGLKDE